MNGGYKIIDFKKVALSSTRVAIAGIMEDLTENNGKVVLLTNVVIGETEMDDCFSTVIVKSDQSIKLNCYDGYISINTTGVKYSSASVENLAEEIGDLEDLETTEKGSVVGAINDVVGDIEDLDSRKSNMPDLTGIVTTLVDCGGLDSSATDEETYTIPEDGMFFTVIIQCGNSATGNFSGSVSVNDITLAQLREIVGGIMMPLPILPKNTVIKCGTSPYCRVRLLTLLSA